MAIDCKQQNDYFFFFSQLSSLFQIFLHCMQNQAWTRPKSYEILKNCSVKAILSFFILANKGKKIFAR